MKKILLVILFTFTISSSNDNVVKTSELELFLFKIGFQSLLTDVEINKDKTKLNEDEIANINQKIELIMTELYKNNRVLIDDSNEMKKVESSENRDLKTIQEEIISLKNEIELLKNKIYISPEKNTTEINLSNNERVVNSDSVFIYLKPNQNSKTLKKLDKDSTVLIESCDKYGWCKLSNKEEYIKEFLLR